MSEDATTLLDLGPGRRMGYVDLPGAPRLPLAVVTGSTPGPTAWVNGSLHGDEYLGPASIAALVGRLTPKAVRGRLILTPTLNVGAARAGEREDPGARLDWNRIWSSRTSRADVPAAVAWAEAELLRRSDVVIDLHSGGNRFLQTPFAVYPSVGGRTDARYAALAKACGLPLIWAHRGSILENALISAAGRRGKPAVLLEIAGEGKSEPAWVERMVSAVRGALAYEGVLRGGPRFLRSYRVFTGFTILTNRAEGRWSRLVEPGARVHRGQPLGRVFDFLGQEVETVASPRDGVVLGLYTYGFIARDEYVAELAHGLRTVPGPR